ncbi:hypothetical protein C4577_03565 [Candidatus Parcubacteria bacterium]|nr:MAG: hypothetical protein C4577_03565 [Candidatus Parcubacteria bacterium]
MYQVWIRDSYRAKWRKLNTREFQEEWEANWYIDRRLDLGKEGEAVPVLISETPWTSNKSRNLG